MAVTEGLKPLDPNSQVPVDPNVHIPDHVRRASEAAEARHKELYTAPEPEPQVQQQAEPQVQQQAEPQVQQQAEPQVHTQNQPQQVQNPAQINPGDDFTGPADQQSLKDSEWARRYNSMHGRWQASERSRAAMEQTMGELGQELVRTQNLLAAQAQTQPSNVRSQSSNKNLITEEDISSYGTDLIDMARRVAMDTVGPEIEALRAENARLTSRVQSTSKRELFATLDQRMPTWRQVNTDPRFIAWLNLPNVYTGKVRKTMLNDAVNGAQAPQVLQMFKDFLAEAQATGHVPQNPPIEQQQDAPPHKPAVDLATLAAPGKARPAQGDAQVPADKPIYSHAQIANYYSEKRRGLWANRIAEWNQLEADFIAAGREGRVR
jgi:hypothetical protein